MARDSPSLTAPGSTVPAESVANHISCNVAVTAADSATEETAKPYPLLQLLRYLLRLISSACGPKASAAVATIVPHNWVATCFSVDYHA